MRNGHLRRLLPAVAPDEMAMPGKTVLRSTKPGELRQSGRTSASALRLPAAAIRRSSWPIGAARRECKPGPVCRLARMLLAMAQIGAHSDWRGAGSAKLPHSSPRKLRRRSRTGHRVEIIPVRSSALTVLALPSMASATGIPQAESQRLATMWRSVRMPRLIVFA